MGLSGPKNRTKLSKDPNNTHWSNETERFGHKILTGLGWAPGKTLGAKDASHADHYTAASASHIRVLLKDDNLGLGARRGKTDEQFGLSIFQNLLGRLNGKSDSELEKEDEKRRDVQLKQFQSQRFGTMHFVSGGFLVGDKIEKLLGLTESKGADAVESTVSEKASKKRKREISGMEENGMATTRQDDPVPVLVNQAKLEAPGPRTAKKQRTPRKNEELVKLGNPSVAASEVESPSLPLDPAKEERRKLKAERRARKEARRIKREEKQKRKEARKAKRAASEDVESESSSGVAAVPTPASFANGRHVVRQRYIQQKRMAYSSEQALKEIFMIKAPG